MSDSPSQINPDFLARLAKVEILLCDVDGVLTDGSVFVGRDGEFKQFSVLDGFGFKLLRESGVKTGWISGRPSPATKRRAKELRVDYLRQSPGCKVELALDILGQARLNLEQACFVGDDLIDVGLLRRAGAAISVPNGRPEARAAAGYVTLARGGHGAVREVVELVLKARNQWNDILDKYAARQA
jgi:3-deoxy-D-manno-octulosonate 8-phosphate phosphatase (KDO 8-P phosphatase)